MDFKSAEDKICDNLREAVVNIADKISYTDYNNINELREDNEKLNKLKEKMRKACMYQSYPEKQLSRRHSFGGKRRRTRRKRGKGGLTRGTPRRRKRNSNTPKSPKKLRKKPKSARKISGGRRRKRTRRRKGRGKKKRPRPCYRYLPATGGWTHTRKDALAFSSLPLRPHSVGPNITANHPAVRSSPRAYLARIQLAAQDAQEAAAVEEQWVYNAYNEENNDAVAADWKENNDAAAADWTASRRKHKERAERRVKNEKYMAKLLRGGRRKTRRHKKGGNPIRHKCGNCGEQFDADNGNMETWKCPSCKSWTIHRRHKPSMKKEYSSHFEPERKRDKVSKNIGKALTYTMKHGERAAKRKRTHKQRRWAPLRFAQRLGQGVRRVFRRTPPTTTPTTSPIISTTPKPLASRPQLLGNRTYAREESDNESDNEGNRYL